MKSAVKNVRIIASALQTTFLVICAWFPKGTLSKRTRHHEQDSVDKSFSNKMVFNSVNSWCPDFFWFKHDVAGMILFKVDSSQLWNVGL